MAHNEHNQGSNYAEILMFVLDVLQYDIEPIESILNLLNDDGCIGWRHRWPADFSAQDVLPALKDLAKQQLVDIYEKNEDDSELVPVDRTKIDIDSRGNEYWFLLTKAGREMWEEWEPEVNDE